MEIELKVKVEDLEKVKQKLANMGVVFEEPVRQVDNYFKRERETVVGPGSFILRTRESDKGNFFTFKALTEQAGAWVEHETRVDNISEVENILTKIGFSKQFTITKERTKGKLGEFEVCIDKVKELGNYVEVGLESDKKEEARDKILQLLNKLGYKDEDIEHRGYAIIISQQMGVKVVGGTG